MKDFNKPYIEAGEIIRKEKEERTKEMKDNEKVELTVGDIKRAAGKCETAKEILKELFPDVFAVPPPGWVLIRDSEIIIVCNCDNVTIESRGELGNWYLFRSKTNEKEFEQVGRGDAPFEWKMENGRIWIKK